MQFKHLRPHNNYHTRHISMKLSTIVIAAILLLAYFFLDPANPLFPPEYQSGHVRHVVDGDTLVLSGTKERIRLWGVDAPELKEKGGQASKVALTQMVKGKDIRFIKIENDRYGRTVARVFVKEKDSKQTEINQWLIENKHATEYCRFSKNFYNYCL